LKKKIIIGNFIYNFSDVVLGKKTNIKGQCSRVRPLDTYVTLLYY